MERKIYFYTNEIIRLLDGELVYPITCEIDLSNRCQLNCSFCMYKRYLHAERQDLDLDIYKCLFRDFRAIDMRSITFTGGGEPLMNPNAIEMVEIAADQDFDLGLITNGVYLDRIPPDLLKTFKFIRISLDAMDQSTYKKIKGADHFGRVLRNTLQTIDIVGSSTTVGWSYVVCEENERGIDAAKLLAREVGVSYIQFKPAWINGDVYQYKTSTSETIYSADRYRATDTFPCQIAGLVGIIGANAKVYYCCQHRGEPYYEVGDLEKAEFNQIWRDRHLIEPKLKDCPMCRYMSYVKAFQKIPPMLIEHRRFL